MPGIAHPPGSGTLEPRALLAATSGPTVTRQSTQSQAQTAATGYDPEDFFPAADRSKPAGANSTSVRAEPCEQSSVHKIETTQKPNGHGIDGSSPVTTLSNKINCLYHSTLFIFLFGLPTELESKKKSDEGTGYQI